MIARTVLSLVLAITQLGQCQQRLEPQTNTFNSDFSLTAEQIEAAGLSETVAHNYNIAIRYEQTKWATGSVLKDPFYRELPASASRARPGSVLKVEEYTDPRNYTIAPTLALSRIIFQSRSSTGNLVPVSAYILWPYEPRDGASAIPLVVWGHGTSGIFPECAPSHFRNLHDHFHVPYELALQGFAVVAPDYAGLGVAAGPDGVRIPHEYLNHVAAGNDLLYAAQAAKKAFPGSFTEEFAVMGHSQGGGAAWGAAQQQLKVKVPGFLGSIAVSPGIAEVADPTGGAPLAGLVPALAAPGLLKDFPHLELSDILGGAGIRLLNLMNETLACSPALATLEATLGSDPSAVFVKPEFLTSKEYQAWLKRITIGHGPFAGSLMVVQSTGDGTIPEKLVAENIKDTCKKLPKSDLTYVKALQVGHVSTLYTIRQTWLKWLDDKFSEARGRKHGKKTKCEFRTLGDKAPRPLEDYTGEINWYFQWARDMYTVA